MSFKGTVDSQWNGQDVKIRGHRVTGKTAFEIGLVVEGTAKLLAPVDTGRLAASITTQAQDRGTAPSGEGIKTRSGEPATVISSDVIARPSGGRFIEVFVGTPVFYAPYVEFGTVRSNAQPFLRPALDLAKGKTLTIGMTNGRYEFRDYLVRSA